MKKRMKAAIALGLVSAFAVSMIQPAMAAKNEEGYGPGYVNVTPETDAGPEPEETAAPETTPAETAPQETTADSTTSEETKAPEGTTDQSTAPAANITWMQGRDDQITNYMMTLSNVEGGGIAYRTYVNNGGFLHWVADGLPSGGTENSTYVEAIQIQLTGTAESRYDVYYSATVSDLGTMGYAVNGELAGTSGMGHYITGVNVVIVPKGQAGPTSTEPRYLDQSTSRITIAENGTTYTNEDGTPYTGWLDYDWVRYYFQEGQAYTGWQYIDGLKFYFDPYGRLVQDVDDIIGLQGRYVIKVNKTLNCLTVYAKDGDNGYIIPVKAMRTSVGDDTPIGTFHTPEKHRWRLMVNDSYTQYATRLISGQGFLLHSITYATPNIYDLNTEGYNGLGVSRSLGCIRLTAENSKWIYDNCVLGTQVTVYEDANVPSPFFKPDLVPIPVTQNYDPTDPLVVKQ